MSLFNEKFKPVYIKKSFHSDNYLVSFYKKLNLPNAEGYLKIFKDCYFTP